MVMEVWKLITLLRLSIACEICCTTPNGVTSYLYRGDGASRLGLSAPKVSEALVFTHCLRNGCSGSVQRFVLYVRQLHPGPPGKTVRAAILTDCDIVLKCVRILDTTTSLRYAYV